MPEKNISKLIWAGRILAMIGAVAAIVGASKGLGEYVTQFAGLIAVVFYELSRRVEQWLPQRSGVVEPESQPGPAPEAEKPKDGEND